LALPSVRAAPGVISQKPPLQPSCYHSPAVKPNTDVQTRHLDSPGALLSPVFTCRAMVVTCDRALSPALHGMQLQLPREGAALPVWGCRSAGEQLCWKQRSHKKLRSKKLAMRPAQLVMAFASQEVGHEAVACPCNKEGGWHPEP